jgi:small subunit ribosomal protein S2
MQVASVKELIDAGVHFGCRVARWNPKMAPYIHGRRNLVHVIDLKQTVRGLLRAQNYLQRIVGEGQQILWVGTKRQVKGVIKDAGERTGMPVVTERWIGGTLTNFSVIRSRLRRLIELETMEEDGSIHSHPKKVIASLRRELRKVHRNLSGIRDMTGIPGAMVVVDPSREANAVREARKMGLVVIGFLDTDCDPEGIDIVIPGNDDALRSVRLMVDHLVRAVEEGGAAHREKMEMTASAERSDEAPAGDEPRPTRGRTIRRGDTASEEGAAPEASAEAEPETTEKTEPASAVPAPAADASVEEAPAEAATPAEGTGN